MLGFATPKNYFLNYIALSFAASLANNSSSPLQQREKLYLLGVGYYRSGAYSRSRQLVDQCLEVGVFYFTDCN